jgi:hypothetical protein
MPRSVPTRALFVAPLLVLLIAPTAFATGTGKTMAAQVIANDVDRSGNSAGGTVHSDFSIMKSLD